MRVSASACTCAQVRAPSRVRIPCRARKLRACLLRACCACACLRTCDAGAALARARLCACMKDVVWSLNRTDDDDRAYCTATESAVVVDIGASSVPPSERNVGAKT
eukprot:3481940-Pleurochrysis_carterae.AAC.1